VKRAMSGAKKEKLTLIDMTIIKARNRRQIGNQKPRLLFALLLLTMVCFHFSAFAEKTVTLAWDPSPGPDISGYKIYYGTASGDYSQFVTVGNTTNATISGLLEGSTYYFAATAYNSFDLESEACEEISYTIPAPITLQMRSTLQNGVPTLFITSGQTAASDSASQSPSVSEWTLESSTDLKVWTDYTNGTGAINVQIPLDEPNRFFRLKK
jgi:hypothetical protein